MPPVTGSIATPVGLANAPKERTNGCAGGGSGALALDSRVATNAGGSPGRAT